MMEDPHEDLSMEDVESTSPLHEVPEVLQSPPFSTTNTATYPPTDVSGHSLNGSGPSTPTHESISSAPKVADIEDAANEIFQPYDVEEPDDEPGPIPTRTELPCLPDSFERWQRDLTEWMDGIGSSPNIKPTVKMPPSQRRGQKRKSPNVGGSGHVQSSPSRTKAKSVLDEPRMPVPEPSPIRRRKRNKLSDDAAKSTRAASLYDFRETDSTDSSSSDVHSTDDYSTDVPNEPTLTDEMDID
ncbi:uncharacterized protein N7443_007685 [Penicillium atrosanguineum]|uniref:uncharacterized protein n=1 Tax=Penicillium atrosanguineum TaxID=1132637 RepID=UPI0023A30846|nr:uncharacterized protein N7443_007685 [Penicillium atrosanguineum]KAJ5296792.1 hypothetical protein N7443_007685 [Penicillium atrosanguineum]